MKTLRNFSITIMLIAIANLQLSAQNRKTTSIKGSGNVITKTITTKPYNIVNVQGSMEVYIEKAKEGNIQVTAEDNVQEYILVESDGKTLTISMKPNTSLQNTTKIKIKVPFEELSEISLRGSGKIEGQDPIKSDVLNVNLKGSGNIGINVETNSIVSELNGSGSIELEGISDSFKGTTTGSGKFNGRKLKTEQAEIYISGSGSSSIFVSKTLSGGISGYGSIFYSGNPTSNTVSVSGSGKVKAQ